MSERLSERSSQESSQVRSLKRYTRPLRHAALTSSLRALSWIARRLPLSWCQRIGGMLGHCARHLDRRSARRVTRRLQSVGDALGRNPDELERVAARHWGDLGRRAGEWLAGPQALSLLWASAEVERSLERAYEDAKRRGLVVLTAHYGHWELLGAWLSDRGFDFLAIASLPPRGSFGAWLSEHRARLGVRVVHPRGGARTAARHLAGGGVVALLVDHSTAERSVWMPFLGVNAPHSMTADRLCARSGAAALWVSSRRSSDGRYEVLAEQLNVIEEARADSAREDIEEEVIRVDPHRDSAEDTHDARRDERSSRDLSDAIKRSRSAHAHLAALISADPAQWLWLHDRWRPRLYNRAALIAEQPEAQG